MRPTVALRKARHRLRTRGFAGIVTPRGFTATASNWGRGVLD
jgi:hypothetical protein